MTLISQQIWLLVLTTVALVGYWLSVRPGASYRGVSGGVSLMIVALAALLSYLAITGQNGLRRANAAPHVIVGN